MKRIVMIVGGKGGTGKTALTVAGGARGAHDGD